MLEFKDVTKTFAGPGETVTALDSVSLSVSPGELVTIEGPSGCGKTTLLLIAGGLQAPTSGSVTLDGKDPYALSPNVRSRLRAESIGFVFQQFHLIPYLTVIENVLAATVPHAAGPGRKEAEELIGHLHLEHRLNHGPAQLSSGERQRTALARALLNKPGIILADEPTGNLDADNADTVFGYLKEYVDKGGAVLLVTHDPRATGKADRLLRMKGGRLVQG